MIWQDYLDPAQVIGGFATGLALLAILVGYFQILTSRRIAQESEAQQSYNEYLKLCIQYPQLSSTAVAVKALGFSDLASEISKETVESEQYVWFASYMLNACEKILLAVDKDGPWRSALKAQIGYHAELLSLEWSKWSIHYSNDMDELVTEALKEHA